MVLALNFLHRHRNPTETLAAIDPAASASAEYWNNYVANWTMWNRMRCAAALVAGVLFLLMR
jgi:uncharacterized membrane protein